MSNTATQADSTKLHFLTGLRDGFPLTVSIFAYGLVFGVLARQAGLTYTESLLMSAFVFAGSSQFAAVAMISTGAGTLQIITATLLLNLRHLLMGASLAPYLRRTKPWRLAILAHGLNDESFALTITHFHKNGGNGTYFFAVAIATFVGWFGSTAVSAAFGNFLVDPKKLGLDFAFYAVFIGLLVPQLKDKPTIIAAVAAALTSILTARFMPGNWHIILAALSAVLAGMVTNHAT
jgi:4-azaleucine resistance transporter AzlC